MYALGHIRSTTNGGETFSGYYCSRCGTLGTGGAHNAGCPMERAEQNLDEINRYHYDGTTIVTTEDEVSITCPKCDMTSYSLGDVKHRYCANCDQFHDRLFRDEL